MDSVTIGYIGMAVMIVLIILGVPISFALGAVGLIGITMVVGFTQALSQATLVYFHESTNFVLIAVPMFVLMGNIANHTGIAAGLFRATANAVGRFPGGLAIAAVFGCAGFGAISGSSTATVLTMGRIVMPELKRYKYDQQLGAGALSAAGTLGILIPPSLILIFYGIMTENSIAHLFIAGIMPGLLTVFLFSAMIFLIAVRKPEMAPAVPSPGRRETIASLTGALPIIALFMFIIGGIYFGIFTPTEASGIAVVGVSVYGIITRTLTWKTARDALKETIVTSTMIFMIIASGYIVSRFVAITGLTQNLIEFVQSLNLGPYQFIAVITIIYLILGCAMDVLAMLILTVPFIYPIILHYGFDPIWFGIYIVVMAEIALITPPLGLNLFVMNAISPDISFWRICKGVSPFVLMELLVVLLITAFPAIVLWLV
ncbi:MAG: TRAP transporter large permease [Rhodobiaceae bacterium]|nr:TRAP transporter large permease [Rhodobiaceae bacterium]MCC0055615.1 TRAP transporter large permease [Rhodobiaceae bacterium]